MREERPAPETAAERRREEKMCERRRVRWEWEREARAMISGEGWVGKKEAMWRMSSGRWRGDMVCAVRRSCEAR